MANRVQHLRHTVTALANFTGLEAEITVNLSSNSVVVHDGITPGGHEQARADLSNVNSATDSVPGKMTDQHVRDLALALATAIQNTIDIATNVNNISIVETSTANNAAAIAQNALDISNLTGGQGAYLLLAGGIMTGAIELSADPVAILEPATKQYTDLGDTTAETNAKTYADGLVAGKADIAGDTFTGPVVLAADPVAALEAATKQFVEAQIAALAATPVTPGNVIHGYINFPAVIQSLSDGVQRVCVASLSMAGKYRVKCTIAAGTAAFIAYPLNVYVYKNGADTGQTFAYTTPILDGNLVPPQEDSFSFDITTDFAVGDTLDIRLKININDSAGINGIGFFAAENPSPIGIMSDSDASDHGL